MIQTINQIINAKKNGVVVQIIIPKKPDKKMVHAGTLYCLKKLIKCGVEVYLYNGFIHAKTLISEKFLSVGSCNFDMRSFKLNFEATSIIFSKSKIKEQYAQAQTDIKNSIMLTPKRYKKISHKNIFFKLGYFLLYRLL